MIDDVFQNTHVQTGRSMEIKRWNINKSPLNQRFLKKNQTGKYEKVHRIMKISFVDYTAKEGYNSR